MKILLLLLSLSVFSDSYSQSVEEKEPEPIQENNQDKETKETPVQTEKKTNSPDTFKPSDKLSKDFPTAFPVDI